MFSIISQAAFKLIQGPVIVIVSIEDIFIREQTNYLLLWILPIALKKSIYTNVR